MASSQSLIHKPKAPTAAFDLGIFSKVLLYKQSKFDQGADQIQAKISQLENQQVIGDAQKKYMSEKINGVIEGVNGMGGMDFSDRNILTQTSSYIDTVTKDPIIASAISNTRNIQKGMSYFEKLKQDAASGKKGVYYNPANEYDYMDGVNDYLRKSKTDPSAAYNEKPITPPVDLNRQLMAAAKDVVASTYTERDGTNKYVLNTGKIVTAERLYDHVLSQMQTDPALANQIRINAKYNYLQKDADGNIHPSQLKGLKDNYLRGTDNKINILRNELTDLAKQKSIAGSKDDQIRIQSQIDDTARELNNYESNRGNRENEINTLLLTNPEAAASNVYSNRLLEGIIAARAFREQNVKFDQSAMFVDKMNAAQSNEMFDRNMAEKQFALDQAKFALSAEKQASDAAIAAGKASGTEAGIYSEELSLSTNVRKSSQETQVDQIRGVQMQQANVQQDYYHYLYQFKNAEGLIQKTGNIYQPVGKGLTLWQDNMKMLKDLRDGKKLPTTLDPEFIKIANKFQDLELVKKQYEDTIIDVNKEALDVKRKELGLSDADYDLFLRGKTIVTQLPEKEVSTGLNSYSTTGGTAIVKDYNKIPNTPENKKAIDIYRKFVGELIPDNDKIEKIYEAKGSQIIPRTVTPIGLKESDLKARAGSLKGQIFGRGYYSLDGSRRPEKTRGEDVSQDKIKYIGDTYIDLGNGLRPYVKAEIERGEGKEKMSETVFVDVDNTYISNFRNFSQNVNEAARQQVLREGSLVYDSASSDGRNIIQTKIVKNGRGLDDESASLQIYVTHDSKGKPITPQAITLSKTVGRNISENVEFAKKFGDMYSEYYKKALQLGKKPTVSAFIDDLNK